MRVSCALWQEALDELKAKAAKLQRTLDQAQREINAIQGIVGELRRDSRYWHLVLRTPACTLHDNVPAADLQVLQVCMTTYDQRGKQGAQQHHSCLPRAAGS